jgi:hypothetical protein
MNNEMGQEMVVTQFHILTTLRGICLMYGLRKST